MTHERDKLTGAPLRASEKRKPRGPHPLSFRARAKTHAVEALEALAELAQNAASESVRVSAANAVLDRAYGRPASGAGKAPEKAAEDDIYRGPLEVEWLRPTKS